MDDDCAASNECTAHYTKDPPTASCTDVVAFSYCNPYSDSLKLDKRLFRFEEGKTVIMDQQWKPGGKGI